MWGLANLGWMYYEVVLQSEPPTTSAVRFLFGLGKCAVRDGLIPGQDKDSPRIDAESALDFIQIAIVLFHLPRILLPAGSPPWQLLSAFLRGMRVENLEDASLTLLAAYQALRARSSKLGNSMAASPLFLMFMTVCAALAQYLQIIKPAPTGTLRDLLWTSPFLVCAMWASAVAAESRGGNWLTIAAEHIRRIDADQRHICAGAIDHTLAGLATGIGVAPASFLASWRFDLCYAARLGISQFRGQKARTPCRHIPWLWNPPAMALPFSMPAGNTFISTRPTRDDRNTNREAMLASRGKRFPAPAPRRR